MAKPSSDLSHAMAAHEWLRAIVASLATIGLTIATSSAHRHSLSHHGLAPLVWVLLVALVSFGAVAVRWSALALGKLVTRRTVLAAGAVVRFVTTGLGWILILLAALAAYGVSLQRLLIGAGLVSVVVGIAAQQTLANIFASLVLLFSRPFNVGETIIIRSGTLGVLECQVRAIGLTYVTVHTDTGLLKIPNAVMAASAIGRLSPPLDPAP
jgi:small-conductance mechanosensitive channel